MSQIPHHPRGLEQRPANRWYQRVLVQLGLRSQPFPEADHRPAGPSDPQAPHLLEQLDLSDKELEEFEAPARGDGLNFRIKIRLSCTWHGKADEFARQEIQREMQQRRSEVAVSIETRAREITRRYDATDCAGVEKEFNEFSRSWVDGDDTITCQVVASVGPDLAVRDIERRTRLRRIELEKEGETTQEQVKLRREQVDLWRQLLEDWPRDQTTVDAVVLALRPDEIERIVAQIQPPITDPDREHRLAEMSRLMAAVRADGNEEALLDALKIAVRDDPDGFQDGDGEVGPVPQSP